MMTWKVIAVGKPKLRFAAEGIQEYLVRIRRFAPCETLFLSSAQPEQLTTRVLKESEQSFRVVLDERGRQSSSEELAEFISEHLGEFRSSLEERKARPNRSGCRPTGSGR